MSRVLWKKNQEISGEQQVKTSKNSRRQEVRKDQKKAAISRTAKKTQKEKERIRLADSHRERKKAPTQTRKLTRLYYGDRAATRKEKQRP